MNERHYSEEEVAEILDRAAAREEALARTIPEGGLTLAELKEIATEVGLSPVRVEEAATEVASRERAAPVGTLLGVPRSVSKVVPIARPLTDDEWVRLVVDLRETFGAKGKVESHGPLRSWSNGNLQVHVEPDGDAFRVRMTTTKADARAIAGVGAGTLGMGALVLSAMALPGGPESTVAGAVVLMAMGLAQLGFVRATLPTWASLRAEQMEGVGERISLLLEQNP